MGALFDRLVVQGGELCEGPRRYFLMRPDVLMGMFERLDDDARRRALNAFAESAEANGADSLRAYFDAVGRDVPSLLTVTAEAAADLGWGRWRLSAGDGRVELSVENSPFAKTSATGPTCAPIRGLLAALARTALGSQVDCRETVCAALGHSCCEFVAESRRK